MTRMNIHKEMSSRYRRDARSFEEDEDMWLNEDREDDDDVDFDKGKTDYGKYMESEKGTLIRHLLKILFSLM